MTRVIITKFIPNSEYSILHSYSSVSSVNPPRETRGKDELKVTSSIISEIESLNSLGFLFRLLILKQDNLHESHLKPKTMLRIKNLI